MNAQVLFLGLALALGLSAAPQNRALRPDRLARGAATPIDEFETLSPEEQRKLLQRLPAGQRQRLEERIRRFNELPPGQQQALRNLYNRLHRLPPERQDTVRAAINRFMRQPLDRRQAMRQQLRALAPLSRADREALFRSPEFRARFNFREQGIVHDMADLFGRQQAEE